MYTVCHSITYGCLQALIGGTRQLVYMAIDRAHLVLTPWVEHGHTTIVYLYLSCVGAKNTTQSLSERHQLVLWRSAVAIKSTAAHGMCCSAASQ